MLVHLDSHHEKCSFIWEGRYEFNLSDGQNLKRPQPKTYSIGSVVNKNIEVITTNSYKIICITPVFHENTKIGHKISADGDPCLLQIV